eukprot:3235113-Prymnesium_polylepis.1
MLLDKLAEESALRGRSVVRHLASQGVHACLRDDRHLVRILERRKVLCERAERALWANDLLVGELEREHLLLGHLLRFHVGALHGGSVQRGCEVV